MTQDDLIAELSAHAEPATAGDVLAEVEDVSSAGSLRHARRRHIFGDANGLVLMRDQQRAEVGAGNGLPLRIVEAGTIPAVDRGLAPRVVGLAVEQIGSLDRPV